jgi:hypothetical protein
VKANRVTESYIASKQPAGAQPSTEEVKIEACISVPQEFTVAQRNAVTAAAELAGISVVNLIEEPIAALYSTRRIENDGWYSINGTETCSSHSNGFQQFYSCFYCFVVPFVQITEKPLRVTWCELRMVRPMLFREPLVDTTGCARLSMTLLVSTL